MARLISPRTRRAFECHCGDSAKRALDRIVAFDQIFAINCLLAELGFFNKLRHPLRLSSVSALLHLFGSSFAVCPSMSTAGQTGSFESEATLTNAAALEIESDCFSS